VPQAVAYAQIAGLPPSAGLAAASGALIAYALLGTESRTPAPAAFTGVNRLSAPIHLGVGASSPARGRPRH
jgi:SulP family sulfate permease